MPERARGKKQPLSSAKPVQPDFNVFVSWSGETSRLVAQLLAHRLPLVVQRAKPWVSSRRIDMGEMWATAIGEHLSVAKFGIICLTPENLQSTWLAYEAGAIAGRYGETYVCPVLFNVEKQTVTPPLSMFQMATTSKSELLRLFQSVNKVVGGDLEDSQVAEAFEPQWPAIEKGLRDIPPQAAAPQRSADDMLNEVLETVRSIDRRVTPIPTQPNVLTWWASNIDSDVVDHLDPGNINRFVYTKTPSGIVRSLPFQSFTVGDPTIRLPSGTPAQEEQSEENPANADPDGRRSKSPPMPKVAKRKKGGKRAKG